MTTDARYKHTPGDKFLVCWIYRKDCPIYGQMVVTFVSDEGSETVEVADKLAGLRLAKERGAAGLPNG